MQTPSNRNCSTKHMWWNPTKCWNNKGTATVCLNLSKAFDTVNPTILKTVMEHYFGLMDIALQWLSSYVSDRKFSVQIGNSFSQTDTINLSVPQGSILVVLSSLAAMSVPYLIIKQTNDTTIFDRCMTMLSPKPSPKIYTGKTHCRIKSW